MATRFYFPETEAAAVSPTISATDWAHINTVRRRLLRAADSSALTTTAYTPDTGTDHAGDLNAHHRQYVSDSLPAQDVAGTIRLQVQGFEGTTTDNQVLTVKIYVCDSAGTTIKETLLAITRGATEFGTGTVANRAVTGTLTSATLEANDRIVVEIGCGGSPGGGGGVQGHNASLRWGCSAAGGDLPQNETEAGTTFRPWIEFSQTLAVYALTLDAATYTHTAATDVAFDVALISTPGAYAFTGATVGLGRVFTVPAEAAAAIAFTGADVTLTYTEAAGEAYSLALDAAAYDFIGATLATTLGVSLAGGDYSITGAAMAATIGASLGDSAYAFVGADVGTVYTPVGPANYTLALDPQVFTATGAALTVTVGVSLGAGLSTLTGADLTTTYTAFSTQKFLVLASGSYDLTGAGLAMDAAIRVPPGAYAFTGAALTTTYFEFGTWFLVLDPGAYDLTGAAATLTVGISAEPAAYGFTGGDLRLSRPVSAEPGVYELIGAPIVHTATQAVEPPAYGFVGAEVTFVSQTSGSNAFALVLASGIYSFTSAGLAMDSAVSAPIAAYSFTGADLGTISTPAGATARALTLEAGIFTLAVTDPTIYEYATTWDPGVYALTGADLTAVHTLSTGAQNFALNLEPSFSAFIGAALQTALSVSLSTPAHTLTGAPLGTLFTPRTPDVYALALDAGVYGFVGSMLATVVSMPPLAGAYAFTGAAITSGIGAGMSPGIYIFVGGDLAIHRSLVLAAGTYSHIGVGPDTVFVPNAGLHHTLALNPATYTFTGADVTHVYDSVQGVSIPTESSSYTLAGAGLTTVYRRKAGGRLTIAAAMDSLEMSFAGAALTPVLAAIQARTVSLDASLYAATLLDLTTVYTPSVGGVVNSLALSAGVYDFVGAPVGTVYTQVQQQTLAVDPATYTFTGAGLGTIYTPAFVETIVPLDAAIFAFVGADVGTAYEPVQQIIELLAAAAYTFTGVGPIEFLHDPFPVGTNFTLSAEPPALFSLVGADLTITVTSPTDTVVSLEAASYAFVGAAMEPGRAQHFSLALEAAAPFTFTGADLAFVFGHNPAVDLEPTAYDFSPADFIGESVIFVATIRTDYAVVGEPAAYSFSGATLRLAYSGELTTRPPSVLKSRRTRTFVSTSRGGFRSGRT